MQFGIIVFPGSNCDRDMATVTRDILNQPTRMIWHEESDLSDVDVIIIPGGFSYGDYLRCGAIARFSPAMQVTIKHAQQGKPVLGVCNGFQVLTEAGLLPGALTRNQNLHFICDQSILRVERNDLFWTQKYQQHQTITLPIAHGEGRYQADADTLAKLEQNRQILLRYSSPSGEINQDSNPNGSLNNIAGISNERGNVVGMMPHPERAADSRLGNTDGLMLFQGILEQALLAA